MNADPHERSLRLAKLYLTFANFTESEKVVARKVMRRVMENSVADMLETTAVAN